MRVPERGIETQSGEREEEPGELRRVDGGLLNAAMPLAASAVREPL